jgi:hypothetical protein
MSETPALLRRLFLRRRETPRRRERAWRAVSSSLVEHSQRSCDVDEKIRGWRMGGGKLRRIGLHRLTADPLQRWQPDPSWPPAPDGWQFWPKARRPRKQRIFFVALVALPIVALFVACGVMGSLNGGCFFDPPPGDVSSFHVTNDSVSPVAFVHCYTHSCTGRESLTSPVLPGKRTDVLTDVCDGWPIGVTSPDGQALLSCIYLPIADPPTKHTFAVSDATLCTA